MRQVPIVFITRLLPLFGVATSLELGNAILMPLLAFLFFSHDSLLFPTDTTYLKRSALFGICIGLAKFGSLLSNVLVGLLSDALGRKPVFHLSIIGIWLMSLGGFAGLYFSNPWLLIVGLFLGFSLSFTKPNSLALLTDSCEPSARMLYFSRMQFFFALGACAGPVFGGYTAKISLLNVTYLLPFLICITFALVARIFLLFLNETHVILAGMNWASLKKMRRQ